MPPLPPEAQQYVAFVKDIITGLSAVVVAVLAVYDVNKWRIELTGRVKCEAARKIVVLSLPFKDEISRTEAPLQTALKLLEARWESSMLFDEGPEAERLIQVNTKSFNS